MARAHWKIYMSSVAASSSRARDRPQCPPPLRVAHVGDGERAAEAEAAISRCVPLACPPAASVMCHLPARTRSPRTLSLRAVSASFLGRGFPQPRDGGRWDCSATGGTPRAVVVQRNRAATRSRRAARRRRPKGRRPSAQGFVSATGDFGVNQEGTLARG